MSKLFYHVTTIRKFERYMNTGSIMPLVRAWDDFNHAYDFMIRTGRNIIIVLNLKNEQRIEGHKGHTVAVNYPIHINDFKNIMRVVK